MTQHISKGPLSDDQPVAEPTSSDGPGASDNMSRESALIKQTAQSVYNQQRQLSAGPPFTDEELDIAFKELWFRIERQCAIEGIAFTDYTRRNIEAEFVEWFENNPIMDAIKQPSPPTAAPATNGDKYGITGTVTVNPGGIVGDGTITATNIAGGHVFEGGEHIHIHAGDNGPLTAEDIARMGGNPNAPEEAYLLRLLTVSNRLPLGQNDVKQAKGFEAVPDVPLDAVYVPLDTTLTQRAVGKDQDAEKRVPVPVLEKAIRQQRLVILGDPGSGKTSFLNALTMNLASASLDPNNKARLEALNVPGTNGQQAYKWSHGRLIPIRVELRELAEDIDLAETTGTARMVWLHITRRLADHNLDVYEARLQRRLTDGECLVMFDGLDEVTDPTRLKLVREAVADFANSYVKARHIVTCRALSYIEPTEKLDRFAEVTLGDLADESISQFITRWYRTLALTGEFAPRVARIRATRLRSAAKRMEGIARNPMLLAVMAIIHTRDGILPRQRAKLFQACVDLLLWNWWRSKHANPEAWWEEHITEDLGVREERLINGLCEVAFHAQSAQSTEGQSANLREADVLDILSGYLGDLPKAKCFLEYTEKQAGLLIGRGTTDGKRVYAFPHRHLQEFLAARHIVEQRGFARRTVELAAKGPRWHEVLLLAVGHIVDNLDMTAPALDAIKALCPPQTPTTADGWRAVWWSGEMLHLVGMDAAKQDKISGAVVIDLVRQQLGKLIQGGHLTPRERAQAADVLGQLGDPRDGVVGSHKMVPIKGGRVTIGPDGATQNVTVKDFYISRYPVTNAQFCRFKKDGGYQKKEYWTTAGWEWLRRAGSIGGLNDDPMWGIANRPVVGITWHEAVAYTRWLAAKGSKPIRLPTEIEWELAAAGKERRKFVWGSKTHNDTTNHREAGIGTTVGVGIFPADRTPEGVHDLGGNVWEWTSTQYRESNYRASDGREDPEKEGARVMRGAAYDTVRTSKTHLLHCTHRNAVDPAAHVDMIGFRVACGDVGSGK